MHQRCYNVSYSYYCPLYRCRVAVTINEHQWEVAAETFCWCHNGAIVAKGCPPPDTRKATVGWDQMGGREIVGQSISK